MLGRIALLPIPNRVVALYFRGGAPMPLSSTPAKLPVILCIDDAEIALRVRKLLLGREGYNVLTARSGEEGLELFRHNPIDLVISDHFLRAKTGTEIAREMKLLKPDVPILIVSAAFEKPPGLEFADAFFPKCQSPDVLLDVIAQLLRK